MEHVPRVQFDHISEMTNNIRVAQDVSVSVKVV